ncbi:MAG: pyridoxamine 5'-phosphate oxidase family protein [Candidatus Limnocylindrales bacterium]
MATAVDADPTGEIDPRYSDPSAEPTAWGDAVDILQGAMTFWISTVRTDGRPHVTTVASVWYDGAMYLTTGDQEQKRVNLASNRACVLTTGGNGFAGLDVVIEAEAVEVLDTEELEAIADAYVDKYAGTFEYDVDASGMHLKGDPAAVVRCYRLEPVTVFGFHKGDPFSQTRWRFER